jgi:hypothetical protein
MKMRRPSAVVLSLLVAALSLASGLAWWPVPAARAASAPTIALIPVSGIVTGQPESVAFSCLARVSSRLVLDTSRFYTPPHVLLSIDLSKLSGTGSLTGAKYVAGGNESDVRILLVHADTVEITFPFSQGTTMSTSSARSGILSFALSFDLDTGAITSGTGAVSSPYLPDEMDPPQPQ